MTFVNFYFLLQTLYKVSCGGLNWFCVLGERHHICWSEFQLSQTRFLRRHITPFLDNWLLDLPWVGSGPGADLLGDINTFLLGLKFRHKFGDMLTGTLGLKSTLFLGSILDNCLGFVKTLLFSFLESTSSRSADLPGFLGASGDGSVLLDSLLLNTAHFLGPLGALGVCGVPRSFIFTLLLNLSLAVNNIILNIMNLLFSPALRLILSSTYFRSLNITVLDQRGSANSNSLIKSNLLIFNETVFPKVLLARLLLLRLIVCDVSSVAPLVIGVITLNNIIILSLFNHLHLVNTFLPSSSYGSKASISFVSLTLVTGSHRVLSMFLMVSMMMIIFTGIGIEGESSYQRFSISPGCC